MKKAVLVLLGAMLLPASAHAAEVSPEKQAQLDQQGWTVVDESEPVIAEAGLNDCRHGAAKKVASGIRDWKNDVLIRGRTKLAVCAEGGRITWRSSSYTHAAPGRFWGRVWGPYLDTWMCCERRSAGLRAKQEWVFRGAPVDQYWQLSLKLTAHVRGDHGVWFSAKRRWF